MAGLTSAYLCLKTPLLRCVALLSFVSAHSDLQQWRIGKAYEVVMIKSQVIRFAIRVMIS